MFGACRPRAGERGSLLSAVLVLRSGPSAAPSDVNTRSCVKSRPSARDFGEPRSRAHVTHSRFKLLQQHEPSPLRTGQ